MIYLFAGSSVSDFDSIRKGMLHSTVGRKLKNPLVFVLLFSSHRILHSSLTTDHCTGPVGVDPYLGSGSSARSGESDASRERGGQDLLTAAVTHTAATSVPAGQRT